MATTEEEDSIATREKPEATMREDALRYHTWKGVTL